MRDSSGRNSNSHLPRSCRATLSLQRLQRVTVLGLAACWQALLDCWRSIQSQLWLKNTFEEICCIWWVPGTVHTPRPQSKSTDSFHFPVATVVVVVGAAVVVVVVVVVVGLNSNCPARPARKPTAATSKTLSGISSKILSCGASF